MFRRIPQIGGEINLSALFSVCQAKSQADFIKALSDYLSSNYVYLLNSGTSAFYIIIEALKKLCPNKEVVLPAYTAPAIVLPLLKSGLKPLLCDISLDDFNLDLGLLPEVVSEHTLCIVPTHLFGIANKGIETLKEGFPEIFVVEDCAQSMGSRIKGKCTGKFGDIGFLSFNRGKNLPTYAGGAIFTDSKELSERISIEMQNLKEQSAFFNFIAPLKMIAFSLALRPSIYGLIYPALNQFKDNSVPKNFIIKKYTQTQAGIGLSLLNAVDELSEKRFQNGRILLEGLKDIKEITLPDIAQDTRPAFNRLPILIKDLLLRDKVETALSKAGIDTSRMYLKPVHHIFDLGYKQKDFPNATYFAKHLLTLPTHALLTKKDLDKIIEVMQGI